MKNLINLLFIVIQVSIFSQEEFTYNSHVETLPNWIQLMYSANADKGDVIEAYTKFYESNKFIKNKHTQYYKRWIRALSRTTSSSKKKSRSTNNWQCVGPWDFDKDANSRSYAPGSVHLYTVEQSISNPNILYAGSATAGLWKTIDKGGNWSLITDEIALNNVYSLEVDFINPEIVYFSGNGGTHVIPVKAQGFQLIQTTDGGWDHAAQLVVWQAYVGDSFVSIAFYAVGIARYDYITRCCLLLR